MKKKKYKIRELFLKEFIKSIIINLSRMEESEPLEQVQEIIIQQTPKEQYTPSMAEEIKPELPIETEQKIQIIQPKKPILKIQSLQKAVAPKPPSIKEEFIPSIMHQFPKSPILEPAYEPTEKQQGIFLGKLASILRDYTVSSIECPGSNKNILISKEGKIQPIQITLSDDEINEIIKEISNKTRIPVMQGVFKAAIANIIITAVISEFVGTRFLIEKRRPVPIIPTPRPLPV